jgi:hypothetical protein
VPTISASGCVPRRALRKRKEVTGTKNKGDTG